MSPDPKSVEHVSASQMMAGPAAARAGRRPLPAGIDLRARPMRTFAKSHEEKRHRLTAANGSRRLGIGGKAGGRTIPRSLPVSPLRTRSSPKGERPVVCSRAGIEIDTLGNLATSNYVARTAALGIMRHRFAQSRHGDRFAIRLFQD
jgi:hypothetical protein